MATASAARARPTAKAKEQAEVNLPSRREFLYYIWGASMALLLGEATAALIWFALPRFAEGEFGGVFTITPDDVPAPGEAPVNNPSGRFWLSSVPPGEITGEGGFVPLYIVCPHLGCLPKWVETNDRFECPCHGSKYHIDGAYIEGPTPRSMDRFRTVITFTDGTTAESNDVGDPISLAGREIASIQIDTGARIKRMPKGDDPIVARWREEGG